MGSRSKNNFEKRFGNPPRFNVVYPSKPLKGSAQIDHDQKIVEAVEQVLTGILGRKPTRDELVGNKRINEVKIKADVAGKLK